MARCLQLKLFSLCLEHLKGKRAKTGSALRRPIPCFVNRRNVLWETTRGLQQRAVKTGYLTPELGQVTRLTSACGQ